MTTYRIGTGIADITDDAIGLQMQGMADKSQKIRGVESRIYARAFVIAEVQTDTFVAILNADIWAGTAALKTEVVKRLQAKLKKPNGKPYYDDANVLISGTHTHSAPGGYTDHKLYEDVGGGFDPCTFECIVFGMVAAIQKAHENLTPGKIYIGTTILPDCGRQRSLGAYLANPEPERKKYKSKTGDKGDTDKEMLLLKFVANDGNKPLGVLNWYAIHPTDRGQKNRYVTGDNKGYASERFENEMGTNHAAQKTFVAAFANSNCGDVSGNVEFGAIPDGIHDKEHMQLHGEKQYMAAKDIFEGKGKNQEGKVVPLSELSGKIDYRHTRVQISNIKLSENIALSDTEIEIHESGQRTWPGALGLAFAAGSTEDSYPVFESIGDWGVPSIPLEEGLPVDNDMPTSLKLLMTGALAAHFGLPASIPSGFPQGQMHKPILLASGLLNPPITPNVVPLQIIQLGNLAVVAIPAEITTMAGRRLRDVIKYVLKENGIEPYVALATYANEYSQYISTEQEYNAQHYEGASTLFGPHTLAAYKQEFIKLAKQLKNGETTPPGSAAQGRSAPNNRRITIRNLSDSGFAVNFFEQTDLVMHSVFVREFIPGHSEYAFYLPGGVDEAKVRISPFSESDYKSNSPWAGPLGPIITKDIQTVERIYPHIENFIQHNLLLIDRDGKASITAYVPSNAPGRKAQKVAAAKNADGRLEVFYVGMNALNSICHIWQKESGGAWSEPLRLGGEAKDIAVTPNAGGWFKMFYAGMDGKSSIYTAGQRASNSEWDKHSKFTGEAQDITIGRHKNGRLEIFYVGTDEKIYHAWQENSNGEWDSKNHSAFAKAEGHKASNVAVAMNSMEGLELFYVRKDDNDSIYHAWQSGPNAEWNTGVALGGRASNIAAARNSEGRLEIFYVGMNGKNSIYCTREEKVNGQWKWSEKHRLFGGEAKNVTALCDDKGVMQVFYVGMDDQIYHTYRKSAGKWAKHKVLGDGWLPEDKDQEEVIPT